MSLQPGQQVKSELLNCLLTVEGKLGEGGQGEVYRVRGGKDVYALKWYNREQASAEQKQAIRFLVQQGAPKGASQQRFIWPLDLVTMESSTLFGYLMPLIDRQRFAELGEVQAHRRPSPSLGTLCEISYQLANSYRALHLCGYCYRDISAGNVMFDPITGDVLICDNDNVGVERQSKCHVWGTMEYMAPEIVLGQADPGTETDLHSLAVLLFSLWMWHHPLHGKLEYNIHIWDLPAKRRIYGQQPIFIFDPQDLRNQLPEDPEYKTASTRWGYCPPSLQALLTRAFTEGLHHPNRRVREGEWQNLFLRLKDGMVSCPKCHAENVWETGLNPLRCWSCESVIPLPPKLIFKQPTGLYTMLLSHQVKLFHRHLKPMTETPHLVIGEVVQHPIHSEVWGIRNLTPTVWTAWFPDGTTRMVEPHRAAPLTLGLRLQMEEVEAEIVA